MVLRMEEVAWVQRVAKGVVAKQPYPHVLPDPDSLGDDSLY
jgi:hypothetical protein